MYLVLPDYLHKNESSATLQQELPPLQNTAQSTKQKKKTRSRVKRKMKKGTKHPYKWVAMRGEIAEAAVGRRALIKAIADFMKVVLHDTIAQKVTTPRSESRELGTQTDMNLAIPPRFVPLPSTFSAGDVYETETSPVSTRFASATALAYDD